MEVNLRTQAGGFSMSVFAWGLGKNGQLGQGAAENENTPVEIRCLKTSPTASVKRGNKSTSQVSKKKTSGIGAIPSEAMCIGAGGIHTGIVTVDGCVFTCGSGAHGRLGTGDEGDQKLPVMIAFPENPLIKSLSCGIWHGAAVSREGQLYIWGHNRSHGVLGINPKPEGNFTGPSLLPSLSSLNIIGVTCGNNYSLAWDDNGHLYSWGCGRHGVLGHGDEEDKPEPRRIDYIEEKVIHADAGFAHCGIVTEDGEIYTTGKGQTGALGFGQKHLKPCLKFSRVPKPTDVSFKEISCSKGEHHGHTLALNVNGEVYAWGDGYKGKLGLGDQEGRYEPTLIPRASFNDQDVIHISAGGIHSAAVGSEGHLYTWGCGSDGRLGHPEAKGHRYLFRSDVPRIVKELEVKGSTIDVKASYYHTVALVKG